LRWSLPGPLMILLAALPAPAGGVFYNSNQSAQYIRSFDRNSAIDAADIVYYNLAGTVLLPPGFSLDLSNQVIFQRATVRTLGNPALGDRRYGSGNPVWVVPNAYLAYRRGGWAIFTGLETLGATAVRRWPCGLPSLDLAGKAAAGYGGGASALIAADAGAAAAAAGATPAASQAAAAAAGLDAGPFPSGSWLRGASAFLAWRHGAAWRLSPRFALGLAGRLVLARQDVQGGVAGACTYDQGGHDLRTAAATLIDVSSRAAGYSGEVCVDFLPAPGLLLSCTYEMATPLDFRTSVRGGLDGGGRFRDGARARLDLPQAWRAGLGWQATPRLRVSAGLNAYLEGAARMDLLDDPAAHIDARRDYGNTYEESAALEYQLDPRWLLSLGVNANQIGQARPATLDTSLPGAHADYLSLGGGCRCRISGRLRANLGLAWTAFVRPCQQADAGDQALRERFAAAGAAIDPRKQYDKRYLVLGLGVEYRWPQ